MDHLQEAYLSVYEEKDDSYLETDMEKRKKNNEKAVEDMKKTKAHRDMVKAAEKHFNESDAYDVILSHLLDEGFADTEQNAITIMANMSEAWIDEILDEAKVDQDLTPLQKIRKRNKEYALPGEPAGQQTSNRRAERSSTRGVKQKKGAKSAFGTMRNIGGPYN